eukprot:g75785.t1
MRHEETCDGKLQDGEVSFKAARLSELRVCGIGEKRKQRYGREAEAEAKYVDLGSSLHKSGVLATVSPKLGELGKTNLKKFVSKVAESMNEQVTEEDAEEEDGKTCSKCSCAQFEVAADWNSSTRSTCYQLTRTVHWVTRLGCTSGFCTQSFLCRLTLP